MAARRATAFRLRLVLELEESVIRRLRDWLEGQLDSRSMSISDGPDLGVIVARAASRNPHRIAPLIDAVERLVPTSVSVRFGPRLGYLPSRKGARSLMLAAECSGLGGLGSGLARVVSLPGRGLSAAHWTRPHILVARSALDEDERTIPATRAESLPSGLRGPFDAVRLSLYCSQITPEGNRLSPLAQVELPVEAAVR